MPQNYFFWESWKFYVPWNERLEPSLTHEKSKAELFLELSLNLFALSVVNYGCFDVQFLGFFRPTQIDNFSHRNVYISAIDRVKSTIEASRKAQFLVFHSVWVVLSFHSKVHKISDVFKKSKESFAAHFIHIFSNLSDFPKVS